MTSLFAGLIFGNLRDGKLRSFITIAAVALGVAISLAIDLANATAVASFARSVNVVASRVNLQVLGVGRGFDERTLLRVQRVAGVTFAAPAIEDSLVVGAHAGDPMSGEVLRVQGIDLLQPLPRDAASAGPGPDPDLLVNRRGAIVSARVARRYGLHAGSTLYGVAGERPAKLVVAEILPDDLAGVDSSVLFVDVATAQEIFGKVGLLDRIDCIVDAASFAAATARVRRVIPPGARAVEPAVRTGEIRRMLQSFQLNLAALSAIALVVGMYLIFNSVAMAVVQRRSEIGTIRALGATRSQVFLLFVLEGLVFGAAGSLAGLALGAVLARFSVAAVAKTVATLYVSTGADRILWDPLVIIKALLVGVVLSVVAAIVPALEAARVPPAVSMRSAGYERRIPHFGKTAAAGGLLGLAAAWGLAKLPALDGIPVFGYLSGLLVIFGGSLCIPIALEAVSGFGRRTFHAAPAQLAAANLGEALRRNSVAVAALAIAIGMMTSVAILIGSFRTTVVAWAGDTLKADLFVRPLGPADASAEVRFPPSVVAAIRAVPGVAAVDTFRGVSLPYRGRLITLGSSNFASLAVRERVRFLGHVDVRELARTLPNSDGVIVSEPFATRFGVRAGDIVVFDTPSGPVRFGIAAVYNDYSSDAGTAIVDRHTFRRLFHDDTVNGIAIYARPGVDLSGLRTRVVRSVLPLRIDIQTNRELRALVVAIFNRTFAITYALYAISMAIALMGVVATLFTLVLERRREIGILRYLGLRASGVRHMILIEAGLVGGIGAIAGMLVGILLALLLIFVINRQAFGWLIELHIPYDFLLISFVSVVVAALVAGLYPASVAARIRTAEAVRSE